MNKKGGEKILSVWWFFSLAIIGAGIVVGVLMFYSGDIDVREIEADILAEKILNCINQQGYLHENFLHKDFDIFTECGLSKEVFDVQSSSFFFAVNVSDESGKALRDEVTSLGQAWRADCKLSMSGQIERAKYYPKCIEKVEGILYRDSNLTVKRGTINVLTGSNQIGKKIQI